MIKVPASRPRQPLDRRSRNDLGEESSRRGLCHRGRFLPGHDHCLRLRLESTVGGHSAPGAPRLPHAGDSLGTDQCLASRDASTGRKGSCLSRIRSQRRRSGLGGLFACARSIGRAPRSEMPTPSGMSPPQAAGQLLEAIRLFIRSMPKPHKNGFSKSAMVLKTWISVWWEMSVIAIAPSAEATWTAPRRARSPYPCIVRGAGSALSRLQAHPQR